MYKRHLVRIGILSVWVVCLVMVMVGFSYYPKEEPSPFPSIPVVVSPEAKILSSVEAYAWPNGTDKDKWDYDTGGFKNDEVRKLYAELGYDKLDADSDMTPCNHFVDVVVYDALGIKMHVMPEDAYEDWGELPSEFEIVHEGPIDDFGLLPGDIIRYKKNKASGYRSQHSLIYYGDGLIAEAGIQTRYPVIYSEYYGSDIIKWEREEVDKDTIQVIRVK